MKYFLQNGFHIQMWIELKGIEEMVEIYYNSGQFTHVVEALVENYASAYQMYQDLWQYYEEHDYMGIQHRRSARYEIVLDLWKKIYQSART